MEKNPYTVAFPVAALRQFAAMINGAHIPPHELPKESHLYFAANRLEYGTKTAAAYDASLREFEREHVDLLEPGKSSVVDQPITTRSAFAALARDRYSMVELVGFTAAVHYWPQSALVALGIWGGAFLINLAARALARRGKVATS